MGSDPLLVCTCSSYAFRMPPWNDSVSRPNVVGAESWVNGHSWERDDDFAKEGPSDNKAEAGRFHVSHIDSRCVMESAS